MTRADIENDMVVNEVQTKSQKKIDLEIDAVNEELRIDELIAREQEQKEAYQLYSKIEFLFRRTGKYFNVEHPKALHYLKIIWEKYGIDAYRLYHGVLCDSDLEEYWDAVLDTPEAHNLGVRQFIELLSRFRKDYTTITPAKIRHRERRKVQKDE